VYTTAAYQTIPSKHVRTDAPRLDHSVAERLPSDSARFGSTTARERLAPAGRVCVELYCSSLLVCVQWPGDIPLNTLQWVSDRAWRTSVTCPGRLYARPHPSPPPAPDAPAPDTALLPTVIYIHCRHAFVPVRIQVQFVKHPSRSELISEQRAD
jgi:hypothetical protein